MKLIQGALTGHSLPLEPRIPLDRGTVVNLDGKPGLFFPMTHEEEALRRWYRHEFLDVERQIAKLWRRQLCNSDYTELYNFFRKWFLIGKPKNLEEVKRLAEAYVDGSPQEASLLFGMTLFGVPPASQKQVVALWEEGGNLPLRDFAPYFHYVYCVDLFYNLAVAADLISRVRPKGKADNKVDIAYLYYLPFCMVFTSSDGLHERVVPLFLRPDQSFVKGNDLKEDLCKLEEYYWSLPDEVKSSGFHKFAGWPPEDTAFLVTRLWDRHLPDWRKLKSKERKPDSATAKVLMDMLNRIEKEAVESPDPTGHLSLDDMQFAQMKRNVMRRKGRWERFGPDVK
ncbi:MAG: hypothetical protein EPN47_16660 [Acidobacteria bacterium]|nr:MAG: hypothetical protein EPN47_16660 [Acidobacteriota bacterium]